MTIIYNGYVINQDKKNKHIMIIKDGRMAYLTKLDEKAPLLNPEQLKGFFDHYINLLKEG